MVTVKCVVCGEMFRAERSSAKYHSEACKQQAKRWREGAERNIGRNRARVENGLKFFAATKPDELGYFLALIKELIGEEGTHNRTWKCEKCGQQWHGDVLPVHCAFCEKQPDFNKRKRSVWLIVPEF